MGRNQNDGDLVPSRDLISVRLDTGGRHPKHRERELEGKVPAAVR